MEMQGQIQKLPKEIKTLISVFLIVLSVGFYSGLSFVSKTSTASPQGIEEHYLGNEDNLEADVMKFKKSEKEMLSIIHSHTISLSLIFLTIGLLLGMTSMKKSGIKNFLMFEPLISVILTFGGLYFLWSGLMWMKFVVIFSGVLMVLVYTTSVFIILKDLLIKKSIS